MTAESDPEEKPSGKVSEQDEIYTMTDLEQIKVVADPLRLRILEILCVDECTTKQVAERIGEKPTRLYHHVEALERVGLIRITRTKQNRGTVEKYFRAVARSFRAAPELFSGHEPGSPEADSLEALTTSIFQNTAVELRRLIAKGWDVGDEEEGILSYAEIRADDATVKKIRDRFMAVLTEFEKECCGEREEEGDRRFRLTLAYYPLDRFED